MEHISSSRIVYWCGRIKGVRCYPWPSLVLRIFYGSVAILQYYLSRTISYCPLSAYWGSQMANRCIVFVTDNAALVSIINQQKFKHKLVMILIRDLVLTALNYNIIFRARHIPDLNNTRADCLSWFQIARFKELSAQADELPTIYEFSQVANSSKFFPCICQIPNFDICCCLPSRMLCSLALCSLVVGKYFPTYKQACYFVHHAWFNYRVCFCGFGCVILCFRFTILSVQPLLTPPF